MKIVLNKYSVISFLLIVLIGESQTGSCQLIGSRSSVTDFSGYSIDQVFSIAKYNKESFKKRRDALHYLAKAGAPPQLTEPLIDLYRQIKSDMVRQSNHEIHLNILSDDYVGYQSLFVQMCLALGSTNTQTAIQFLREETNPKKWDHLFLPSPEKSMTSEDSVDFFFRDQVFLGLLAAAVRNPEIFDEIESYPDDYLRKTKLNVKSWFPDYKEKYFALHPEKIPEKGYILVQRDDVQKSFFFLLWRMQTYFGQFGVLPKELLDLTIKRGGNNVYLPADPYSPNKDQLLQYFYVHEGQKWTYLLASVGENGVLDINPKNLKTGLKQEALEQAFPEKKDDVLIVLTYTSIEGDGAEQ